MEYPKRHENHVTETAAFKRLEQCIPAHWLVRYLSERDYGLDCLIEPVTTPGGAVQGDMLAIQLKGTDALRWKEGPPPNIDTRRATFSGVHATTVNYWMGLPVPVFLCVHEASTGSIYFAPVKRQVRRRYGQWRRLTTFAFELSSLCDLADADGLRLLLLRYFQERSFPEFAGALTDLIEKREHYADLIESGIGRDWFLEVELSDLVGLHGLYKNCLTVTQYSNWSGSLPSFDDAIAEDQRTLGNDWAIMHEGTRAQLLVALIPGFLAALKMGAKVVTELEFEYWHAEHNLLARYAETLRSTWLDDIETRLRRATDRT